MLCACGACCLLVVFVPAALAFFLCCSCARWLLSACLRWGLFLSRSSVRCSLSARLRQCLSLISSWSISVCPCAGQAPTFLCRLQRKVGKRKQLKPLMLSGHRSSHTVVVHLESVFVHLHMLVTRDSSAPTPHCVRRGRVCMGNPRLRFSVVGAVGCARAPARACDKGVILPAALRAPMSTSSNQRRVFCLASLRGRVVGGRDPL
ncbi:hypothetical protein LMG28690_01929 [Paraburkholderia caffeinilytica]|nr:hypothetical protein LMG28690_01929 [Paraburkholderia caffeinilytica]